MFCGKSIVLSSRQAKIVVSPDVLDRISSLTRNVSYNVYEQMPCRIVMLTGTFVSAFGKLLYRVSVLYSLPKIFHLRLYLLS